jgi:hypothetical protein
MRRIDDQGGMRTQECIVDDEDTISRTQGNDGQRLGTGAGSDKNRESRGGDRDEVGESRGHRAWRRATTGDSELE